MDMHVRAGRLAELLRWKREVMPLLEILDECHDLLPVDAQAQLGHSKAEAVREYLRRVTRPA